MNTDQNKPFSKELQSKVDQLMTLKKSVNLGSLNFSSPLLLAPMSAISNTPFRLLMENLGAGGTVSELISCHGINYKNELTLRMLKIDPREKNCAIQLFGEDPEAMAKAAAVASEYGPKFIDINMGCPVRKVVTKGGGSALLKDTKKLSHFLKTIKSAIDIPLTIKIRTGWDEASINAPEVINIAQGEGVEFVAIHGRTRAQAYKGLADWKLLEKFNQESKLPLIGNGDLHTKELVQRKLLETSYQALMLGRGPLRNPFLFLEGLQKPDEKSLFTASDLLEVIKTFHGYWENYTDRERTIQVQMKKHIVWFSAGLDGASKFRANIFTAKSIDEILVMAEDYFLDLGSIQKKFKQDEVFMAGGHG